MNELTGYLFRVYTVPTCDTYPSHRVRVVLTRPETVLSYRLAGVV